jgi:glutamate racemase
MLKQVFPYITFLDPAYTVANQVSKMLNTKKSKANSIRIFTSGNVGIFQKQLLKLGIRNKVRSL